MVWPVAVFDVTFTPAPMLGMLTDPLGSVPITLPSTTFPVPPNKPSPPMPFPEMTLRCPGAECPPTVVVDATVFWGDDRLDEASS